MEINNIHEINANEVYNLCVSYFKQGNIQFVDHILNSSPHSKTNNNLIMMKGIIEMNKFQYQNASDLFWSVLENDPLNGMVRSNLNMLPKLYQKKKYIINLEGYANNNHSFSVIFHGLVNHLYFMENVDLRVECISLKALGNIQNNGNDPSFYNKVKPVDKTIMADLTIRILYPFDVSPCPYSKKTLVFIVTEKLWTRTIHPTHIHPDVFIMTPSNHSKEIFMKQYDFLTDDCCSVIPHGIDYSRFNILSVSQITEKRALYNINNNDFVFLHISSNTGNKNVPLIIESFLKLKSSFVEAKNSKLILKFNTTLYNFQETKNIQETYANNESIIVINDDYDDNQMSVLYNICNCYVSASSCEGFNLPVLQACAYGKNVICPQNSPTDEFTCGSHNVFNINTVVNDDMSVQVTSEDIFKQMKNALFSFSSNNEFNNSVNISKYLKDYNWSNIAKYIVSGYLEGPFYMSLLEKIIVPTNGPIDVHYDTKIKYIKECFDKLFELRNLCGVKIGLHNISHIHLFNLYKTILFKNNPFYFNCRGERNITFFVFFNTSHSQIETLKIHNCYKSLIIDEMLKYMDITTRNSYNYNTCSDLIEYYDWSRYICMVPYTYFLSTYVSPEKSKKVKSSINQNIQNVYSKMGLCVENNPVKINGKYDIAIIGTGADFVKNPVYGFVKNQLISLSKIFNIHIFIIGNDNTINDDLKPYVSSVNLFYIKQQSVNFFNDFYSNMHTKESFCANFHNMDKFLKNSFMACYILVIGCEVETIYLSNLQIAPIQFSGYGHPISSFGSKNNYYMVSKDVESDDARIDLHTKLMTNYTETPIFIDNLTTVPLISNGQDFLIDKNKKNSKREILVSCTFKKLTPHFLQLIERISKKWLDETGTKLKINFYVGPCGFINDSYYGCNRVVESSYYDHEIHLSTKSYEFYLECKSNCYLAFDSFEYAGFTTILENVKIGVPTVVLDGLQVVNNFPKFIYKKLRLDEDLVTRSFDEYYEKCVRLLMDDNYYHTVREKIINVDFRKFYDDLDYEPSMIKAFENLIHEKENILGLV